MKKLKLIIAEILGFIIAVGSAQAQTIHVVLYANTVADDIGKSVKKDVRRVRNEVSDIAREIGYGVLWNIATTEGGCKKDNLLSDINSLQTNPEDIIFFYYSGHGWRKKIDTDPFPRMCLTERYSDDQPQVAEIRSLINRKSAHLKMIVTDCCDSFPRTVGSMPAKSYGKGPSIISKGAYTSNYKKLFIDTKGEIVITSSKPEQTSGCNDEIGGFFTYAFFDILKISVQNTNTSDWNTILESTRRNVMQYFMQEPYYQFNGQSSISQTIVTPTDEHAVYPEDPGLAALFTNMINKKKSDEYRLSLVSKALNYFTADAQIVTIGSDMKTVVKRESAKDFLKRICLSPNLVQINVLEELTAGSKKKELTIHEVRTKINY